MKGFPGVAFSIEFDDNGDLKDCFVNKRSIGGNFTVLEDVSITSSLN